MQQVPYAIIGNGRMARHFAHYLRLLHIPFLQWSRSCSLGLNDVIQASQRILLLINDDAIEDFITANPLLSRKIVIHCSGKLSTPLAFSAHPLLTFGPQLYNLNTYQKMPFILENRHLGFAELFPELLNPHYIILSEQKALYHSLCVLSGNFTVLLWQKFFKELTQQLAIPAEAGQLYMQQIFANLMQDQANALTGPLVRNDQTTIAANLDALAGDAYQAVYQAFVTAYQQEKNNER